MDIITRNEIMINHEYMINAVIRRNRTLLKALRIENDDAYQELYIAMLKALENYNPMRSESLGAYLWVKLQYAVLDMKRRHKPCGITGTGGKRIMFVSVDYTYDNGYTVDIPYEDDRSEIDLSDILAALDSSEREALDMRMDGQYLKKKSQRESFSAACEKLLAMI
jgi:DNA-directed RNA polymerase specialized sigma24 family protein